jgi:hypothetical protein
VKARRISQDFVPDGNLDEELWQTTQPAIIECQSRDYAARPEVATEVRLLWSNEYLYLGYTCPFTKLTFFEPTGEKERHSMKAKDASLWDRDVVEAFIGSDPENIGHYTEYQVAPTNEKLDLKLALPDRDFEWSSRFESAVRIDRKAKVWHCEMRIPMSALSEKKPSPGARWRLNLFRCDRANSAFLAWSPTMNGNFHTPEKFGTLEFAE